MTITKTNSGDTILQKTSLECVGIQLTLNNACNKCLTAKLLKQGYRYQKLRKAFSKFYRRHHELVSKFNVGLKYLLHQGLPEPELKDYGED